MKQFCLNVCSVKDTDIKSPRLTKRNKIRLPMLLSNCLVSCRNILKCCNAAMFFQIITIIMNTIKKLKKESVNQL